MFKTCPQCGKNFTAADLPHASNFKRQKLCSNACMHAKKRWTAEKSLEVMWSRIDKNGPNGCWVYSGQVNSKGYGAFTYAGKPMVAVHRFIYQQIHGPLHRKVYCLHKCDNTLCVNPDHIFLGDDRANMLDKVQKERHKAALRSEQVREIREALKYPRYGLQRELCAKYKVKPGVISDINMGQTYQWVK